MSLGPTISFVIRSLKLCAFPLASTGAGIVALVSLPQGAEVLRTINDNGLWNPNEQSDDFALVLAFMVAISLWSLANWYAARLVVQSKFTDPGPALAARRSVQYWRVWFPRMLVPAGLLPIAASLAGWGQLSVASAIAALAVGLFSFVILRRELMFRLLRVLGGAPAARTSPRRVVAALPEGEALMLWLAGSLAIVLFVTLAKVNYSFARWLGAGSIMLIALASISLFSTLVLVYWPKQYGWPALTGLAIALALLFGTLRFTANHAVASRRVDADLQTRVPRPHAYDQFRHWLERKPEHCAVKDGPIILVAAEGGASRSAWWSAHVLGVLDDLTSRCFGDRVFAASGISGGSLGVATWVALRRDRLDAEKEKEKAAASPAPSPFPHPTQDACESESLKAARSVVKSACFLGRDFVAPVVGYMMGVDLAQRFIPVPVTQWDRSNGLEKTWTRDWSALFGTPWFARPLLDLYRPGENGTDQRSARPATMVRSDIPVLLLNTATVDRGRPAVQAPVRLPDPEIDDLLDPALRTAGLTLAGAVHNSARFPYVSPGGDVQLASGEHFDSVVDGGYVENSGALALGALMRSARPDKDVRSRLVVVFIANDPAEPLRSAAQLCAPEERPLDVRAHTPWGEAVTPAIGLFKARSGRADTSRRALVRELGLCDNKDESKDPHVFFVSMASPMVQEINPVMSWYMTPLARDVMWRAVATDPARSELLLLAEKLGVSRADASMRLDAFGAVK